MSTEFKNTFTSGLAGILAVSVLLSGFHAKEITSLVRTEIEAKEYALVKAQANDDDGKVKIHHDAHNHIDKQTVKSMVKVFGDHNSSQAEPRHSRRERSVTKRHAWDNSNHLFGLLYQYAVVASSTAKSFIL